MTEVRLCVLFGTTIFLVGCTQVPNYSKDPRILPTEVLMRAQCELKHATTLSGNTSIDLTTYSVGLTLSMIAESEFSPNVSGDWTTIPYHLTDTFNASVKAGITDNVSREGSIDYFVNLADLNKLVCPEKIEQAFASDPEEAKVIYGSFGIANWFQRVAGATEARGVAELEGPMSYSVKFAVTTSGTASPGFKIVNFTGLLNMPAKSIDTHKLTMAFEKTKPPGPPPPQKVCVTNMGASCDPPKTIMKDDKKAKEDDKKKEQGKKGTTTLKRSLETFTTQPVQPSRPQRRPLIGVPASTRYELQQQLNILKLRDAIRER